MKKTIAVLGYHKIGEPPGGWYTWSYVSAETFEAQLQFLKDNDWRVIDLATFIYSITEPNILPERSVLITFDDGYYSNLTVASPVLQKFNYPAVIFVPVHFIGGYNAFDSDVMYEPKEQICSWEQLISLDQQGISVQSHGLSHRHFSRLLIKDQVAEAVQSKALLEDRLNKQVDAFSFPYGDNGPNSAQTENVLVQAGYRAAFLYGGEPCDVSLLQPYALSRIPIGPDTDMRLALEKKVVPDQ